MTAGAENTRCNLHGGKNRVLGKMIANFWIEIPPLSEPTAALRPDVVFGRSPGRLRQGPEVWSKGGPRRREAPEG